MENKEIILTGAQRLKLDKLKQTHYGKLLDELRSSIADAITAYTKNKPGQCPKTTVASELLDTYLKKNPFAPAVVILQKLVEALATCDKSRNVDKTFPEQLERILKNPRYAPSEFPKLMERDFYDSLEPKDAEAVALNAAAVELVKKNLLLQQQEVARLTEANLALTARATKAEEQVNPLERRIKELTDELQTSRERYAILEDKQAGKLAHMAEAVGNLTLLVEQRGLNGTILTINNIDHQPFDETTKMAEINLLKHITLSRLKAILILAKQLKDNSVANVSQISASNPMHAGLIATTQANTKIVDFIVELAKDNQTPTKSLIAKWASGLGNIAGAPAFKGLAPQFKTIIEEDPLDFMDLETDDPRKFRYFYQLFFKGRDGVPATSLQNDELASRFNKLRQEAKPKADESQHIQASKHK